MFFSKLSIFTVTAAFTCLSIVSSVTNYDSVCDYIEDCSGTCSSCSTGYFQPSTGKDCIDCSVISECNTCTDSVGCDDCDDTNYDSCVLATNACGLKVCKCIDIDSKMTELNQLFAELVAGAGEHNLTVDLDAMFSNDFAVYIDVIASGDLNLLLNFNQFCDLGGSSYFSSQTTGNFNVIYDFTGSCNNSVLGEFSMDATGSIVWNEDGQATQILHNYVSDTTRTKISDFMDSL